MNTFAAELGRLSPMLSGLLIALICLPLISGKIPRNRFYGVRTKWSLQSNANWQVANRRGGKLLLMDGLFIATLGVVGFLVPSRFSFLYLIGEPVLVILLVAGTAVYLLVTEPKNR